MNPLIIGHRGASALAPENTLAALGQALAEGADGVEFDVRLARDRVAVVIHDATLARTGRRSEAVAALTSAELGEVDVGTWFNLRSPAAAREEYARERVPTLDAALALVGERARAVYVEMKCAPGEDAAALAEAVVSAIRARRLEARVVVKSFAHASIAEVKRLAPDIRTAALFERRLTRPVLTTRAVLERARLCGADEISLHHTLVGRRLVEAARARGLGTVVWTVDDAAWVARARALALRAVITNRPALLRAALSQTDTTQR